MRITEQKEVQDLPLVGNDFLDLVQVMAGINLTNNPIFGAGDSNSPASAHPISTFTDREIDIKLTGPP